jgi:hypothetical protein
MNEMNYHRELKTILENHIESDEEDSETLVEAMLDYNNGLDEIREIIEARCRIYLSEEGREFIRDYVNSIEGQMENAENLVSDEGEASLEERYRMLQENIRRIKDEVATAVDEEEELENIAVELKDGYLAEELEKESSELEELGRRLEMILEEEKILEEYMEKYQQLQSVFGGESILASLEHRKEVLQMIQSEAEEASERREGERIVYIPEEMFESIQEQTVDREEGISGALLCRRKGRDLIALKNIKTGEGSEGDVSTGSITGAVGEFVRNYKEKYTYVHYHTHTAQTIEEHGPELAENWSERDIENFESQWNRYIGMLFTPETVLIKGKNGDPDFNVLPASDINNFEEMQEEIEEDFGNTPR